MCQALLLSPPQLQRPPLLKSRGHSTMLAAFFRLSRRLLLHLQSQCRRSLGHLTMLAAFFLLRSRRLLLPLRRKSRGPLTMLAAFRSRPLRRSQGRLTMLEASIPLRRKSRGRLTMLAASNLPPLHLPSQRRLHRLLLRSRRRRSSRIWRVAARRTATLHLQEAALVPSQAAVGSRAAVAMAIQGTPISADTVVRVDTVAVRTACSRRRNSSLDTVLRVHTGRVTTDRGTPRWAAPPAALLDTEAAADTGALTAAGRAAVRRQRRHCRRRHRRIREEAGRRREAIDTVRRAIESEREAQERPSKTRATGPSSARREKTSTNVELVEQSTSGANRR